MTHRKFDVAIVGGGIGGLCLAQGLKKAGIAAHVYERDESAAARPQGFRIHIDPNGSLALHQCLPPELWQIFNETGGEFSQGFTMMTEQLEELLRMGFNGGPADSIARHRSISRITLRSVLLSGIEQNVHFGKRFTRYENLANGRIAAHFEDGTSAEASILAAADGVNSAVRKQYLPHADPVNTGVLTMGGRVRLSDGVMALVPDRLLDGPVLVIPPQQCSLFMAIWKRPRESSELLRKLGMSDAAADEQDYLVLGLAGRTEYLGLTGEPGRVSGSEVKQILRRCVQGWHPNLRKLAEMMDENETNVNILRTSRRLAAWQTTNVTLLGDAVHSMTPFRGIGANIALRDAALLSSKLTEAARGQKLTWDAIGEYETVMRAYAFDAVEASLNSMEQSVYRKKNPGFGFSKTAMRVINRVPALKRRLIPA